MSLGPWPFDAVRVEAAIRALEIEGRITAGVNVVGRAEVRQLPEVSGRAALSMPVVAPTYVPVEALARMHGELDVYVREVPEASARVAGEFDAAYAPVTARAAVAASQVDVEGSMLASVRVADVLAAELSGRVGEPVTVRVGALQHGVVYASRPTMRGESKLSKLEVAGSATGRAAASRLVLEVDSLRATKDTTVDGQFLGSCVGENCYNTSELRIVAGAGAKYALATWDLGPISSALSGWTVVSATLKLKTKNAVVGSSMRLDNEHGFTAYSETACTCSELPSVNAEQIIAAGGIPDAANAEFSVVLGSVFRDGIRSQLNAGGLYTIMLTTADTSERQFYSREGDAAACPRLHLVIQRST